MFHAFDSAHNSFEVIYVGASSLMDSGVAKGGAAFATRMSSTAVTWRRGAFNLTHATGGVAFASVLVVASEVRWYSLRSSVDK